MATNEPNNEDLSLSLAGHTFDIAVDVDHCPEWLRGIDLFTQFILFAIQDEKRSTKRRRSLSVGQRAKELPLIEEEGDDHFSSDSVEDAFDVRDTGLSTEIRQGRVEQLFCSNVIRIDLGETYKVNSSFSCSRNWQSKESSPMPNDPNHTRVSSISVIFRWTRSLIWIGRLLNVIPTRTGRRNSFYAEKTKRIRP